jgi:hypothetical protein
MSEGQLALNSNNGSPGLFFKDSNANLVKVGPVHVGTTAPNASPAVGGTAGNSVGEQWLDTSSSRYVFKVWDGTAWRTQDGEFVNVTGDVMTGALGIIAGSASAPGLYVSGDTNTGLFSAGSDQLAISTGGVGRLFVDASGRVGIGIASPAERLAVSNAGAETIELGAGWGTNLNYIRNINRSTGLFVASLVDASEHRFFTTTTERVRIDGSGRVGIGTSSPWANHAVAGSGTVGDVTTARQVGIGIGSGFQLALGYYQTGSGAPQAGVLQALDTSAGTRLLLNPSGGNVGIGTTSPTATLYVNNPTLTAPSLTYGATAGQVFKNELSELAFGVATSAPFSAWMQGRFSNSANQNISLNPLGGNVGIGTAAPRVRLHVQGDDVTLGGGAGTTSATLDLVSDVGGNNGQDAAPGIAFRAPYGATLPDRITYGAIWSKKETSGQGGQEGALVFGTNTTSGTGVTEKVRITSGGYVRLATGTGGIQFNGDTAAANALDDYEEGTWTPTLQFGGSSTGITYSLQSGAYTKIGRKVHVVIEILLSNKGSATGSAAIAGLPFAATSRTFAATVNAAGSLSFTNGYLNGGISSSGSSIVIYNTPISGSIITLSDTGFTNTTGMRVDATYYV